MSTKKNPAGIVRNQRGKEAGEKGEKPRLIIISWHYKLRANTSMNNIKFI